MAPKLFRLLSSALLMLALLTGFGAAAPANNWNPHDWHECDHIQLSKRGYFEDIPHELPEDILATRKCNKVPKKYLDAHCGNVLWVVKDFCSNYAIAQVHAIAPFNATEGNAPTITGGKVVNDLNIEVGPVNYNSREYIHGPHLNLYFAKEFDMFNLTVESVRGCVTDGVDLDNPEGDMTCDQMMWGAWTGCNNNKGRGGSVTAGCLKYSFDTLY